MWPDVLPLHDIIAITCHGTSDILGFLANLSLWFAIVLKTPPNLKTYSFLLLNTVTIDCLACFSSLVTMIRLIPADMCLVYIFLGPCNMISPFVCHLAFCSMLHTFTHSLYLVIVQFSYRIYVLKHASEAPSRLYLAFICVLVYIPSICMFIIFSMALDPEDVVLEAMLIAKPDFEWNMGYMWTGHADISKFKIAFTIAFMICPSIPMMLVIFTMRAKVLGILRKNIGSMSAKTHNQHLNLVSVLSLQSILPIFFFIGGLAYTLCQAFNICSVFQEHLTMSIWGIMPAAAPFITIYYVQPYKLFIFRMLRVNHNIVASSGSSVSGGGKTPIKAIHVQRQAFH